MHKLTTARRAAAGLGAVLAVLGMAVTAPDPVLAGAATASTAGSRYIVALRSDVDVTAAAHTLTERYGGRVDRVYDKVLHGFALTASPAVATRLARDPRVAYATPDQPMALAGTQANPPSWGLDRIDQRYLPLDDSYSYPDSAMPATVVVIDSGIRISHDDFGGRAHHLADLVDGDFDADDCNGHGTAVAGVIGGATYGVAKDVRLDAIRVADCAGAATMSRVIDALNLVAGVPVPKPALVNLSLQLSCSPMPSCGQPLNQAIRDLVGSGYPVVVAAGNGNQDACGVPAASVAQAITVGATRIDDTRRADSNFGPCVDLWAPGDGIVTAGHTSDTATATFGGTSMAAPHVSGVVAMLMSTGVDKTPTQVATELNGMTTTRVVTNIGGTSSPNKLLSISGDPLDGARWAYVWADQPTSAAYSPHPFYQGNSTGGTNTISRTGTGSYAVRFAGIGAGPEPTGGGGMVHATAYGAGSTHWCKVSGWFPTGADLTANVQCFTLAGAPVDTLFTASFTGTLHNPADFGYVWANLPSSPPGTPYVPAQYYQFNTMGRTNTVAHFSAGRYSVVMPGLGGTAVGGTVLVSGYGSAPVGCVATDWFSTGTDLVVDVQCRNTAGTPTDGYFTVTYARGTSPLGVAGTPAGYVRGDQPSTASYTPPAAMQHNSTGGTNTVARNGTGNYTVHLPGLGQDNGHVAVTTVAFGSERCKVGSWGVSAGGLVATVRCFASSGAPQDARFTLAYVR